MSLMRWTLVLILLVLNGSWVKCQECVGREYTRDPFDCNAYFQCDNGRWVQRFCPPFLHWNPLIKGCDWSWNANCELDGTTTTSTSTAPPTTTTETTSPPETTTTQTTPTPPPTTTTETTPTTTTPDPGATTTTQTTTTAPPGVTTTTAPPGVTTTTAPPGVTTTTSPPGVTTTTSPPETTTTQTTPTPPPTTTTETTPTPPPTTTTPPVICTPSCNPREPQPQHLPHPNCSMFYKCAHGIPHEMVCRFAQHWSIASDRCESPDIAECNDGDACEQADARPPDFW